MDDKSLKLIELFSKLNLENKELALQYIEEIIFVSSEENKSIQ